MSSAHRGEPTRSSTHQTTEEMTLYGITCVPVDYFHFRNFRYTSLAEAVAEAKRQQRLGK
jgi:hypothetical protein